MFISHPPLLCRSANRSPAAPSSPAVFNWQIDCAVCKPGHLQKTADWLVVKCHRVTKHQADHNVALWPDVPGRAYTWWQMVHYIFEHHEFWMGEKMKTFPTLCWESSESPSFPLSYIIIAELRSECSSSAQKPKFNCLLARVYPGRRERQQECVLCVLREGCTRTPRLLQHTNSQIVLSQHDYNMIEAQVNISSALLMLLTKYLCAQCVRSIMCQLLGCQKLTSELLTCSHILSCQLVTLS